MRAPLPRRILGYLLVVIAMTWPMAWEPMSVTTGFANVDAQDTQMLRGLFAELMEHPWDAPHTDQIYFPEGFPLLHLTPNLLDHLSGTPFVWLLPFPLSDNLWWLVLLVATGLAGHRLGRRLGGSEAAGWLAGLGFLLSEPLLREANLHHAPQSMVLWAPLYLDTLLDLREAPSTRKAIAAGALLAGAALSYWYLGLFLGLGTLPLLLGLAWRPLLALGGTAALLSAPALLPFLLSWGEIAVTATGDIPALTDAPESFSRLPTSQQFIARHGADPLFWLGTGKMDLSNRVSLVLILAAALGARAWAPRRRLALLFLSGLGAVMVLGPYLRWGDEVVLVGDQAISLPFRWLGRLHPVLARLTWPERWGILVPLGLVALAARAPRPGWLAGLLVLESALLSANLPLQTTSLRFERCWAQLRGTTGAVVELPIRRGGLRAPRVGVHQRFHRRAVVNPVLLPPGAKMPEGWEPWMEQTALMKWLRDFEAGEHPSDPGAIAVREARAAGVSVIAADVEPGGMSTAGGVNRYRAAVGKALGPPIDLGCALVWWLDTEAPAPNGLEDGDAWRAEVAAWKEAHPAPELDTLMQPTWDAVQRPASRE